MADPVLTVKVKGDTKELGTALDDGGRKVSAFGKSIDLGGIGKLAAFTGVAGIAVTALAGLASAAADDRLEAEQLAAAIAAAGAATGDWSAQVDSAIAKGAELAYSDTQIRDALTPLVGVTGDMTRANELLATAEDVARLRKVDLATAAEAVAKAEGGQTGALSKLVQVNAAGMTSTQLLAAVQAKAAGQANVYGKSSQAAGERAAIGFGELGEKLGAVLLPLLDALMPALLPIVDALGEMIDALLPILIPMVKLLGAALTIVGRVIGIVARAIAELVRWFAQAIGAVGDFLSSLGPVQALGDVIGGLFGGPGPGAIGTSGPGYAGAGVTGPRSSTIIVNASGADPDAVVRAIRRWAQVNGGYPALVRKVSGS